MPYVIRRPTRLPATIVVALAALAFALVAVPAAQAACSATATTKAFAAFGDGADYSLVPGGAFESGATGWSLTGSSVAAGNESWKVHGSSDWRSLTVNATGQAVSPAFCVGVEHPTFRFFARRTGGSWGTLNVVLRWTTGGATHDTTVASINGGDTAWHVTDPLPLSSVLPLGSNDAASVQIVLDPEDYGSSWAIDDVYVDPYTRG